MLSPTNILPKQHNKTWSLLQISYQNRTIRHDLSYKYLTKISIIFHDEIVRYKIIRFENYNKGDYWFYVKWILKIYKNIFNKNHLTDCVGDKVNNNCVCLTAVYALQSFRLMSVLSNMIHFCLMLRCLCPHKLEKDWN
jgi:hypothetical protein